MTGPARSRPAATEGFWEGLFRQSRRDQSRHSMDLGAVPFSSPPTRNPSSQGLPAGCDHVARDGCISGTESEGHNLTPESTRFPAGRRIETSEFCWARPLYTLTLTVVTHTMAFSETPSQWYLPEYRGAPPDLCGLCPAATVRSRAPLGGGNLNWLLHTDAQGPL